MEHHRLLFLSCRPPKRPQTGKGKSQQPRVRARPARCKEPSSSQSPARLSALWLPWTQPLHTSTVKGRISVGAASNSRIPRGTRSETFTAGRGGGARRGPALPRAGTSPGRPSSAGRDSFGVQLSRRPPWPYWLSLDPLSLPMRDWGTPWTPGIVSSIHALRKCSRTCFPQVPTLDSPSSFLNAPFQGPLSSSPIAPLSRSYQFRLAGALLFPRQTPL